MAPVVCTRSLARDTDPNAERHDLRSSPFETTRRQSEPLSPWAYRTMPARSAASLNNNNNHHRLAPRLNDNANTVPETYGAPSGPNAGTVVGIVLGSVGGFLLVLWIIYTLANLGNGSPAVIETGSVGGTESVVTRKSRKQHRRRTRSASDARRRSETVEVRRTTERVVPVSVAAERIVVEERSRSRQPPPPMPAPPPPMPPPPPRVVHDDSDDEVVVIEENSPPRRRESRHHARRQSSRRSSERRRSSGYRDIDPYRFAGGDASVRSLSRRRSYSRDR
ncbi:hypothetical protein LQW54_008996 [Pestalotiopsis sp. IQ-011]